MKLKKYILPALFICWVTLQYGCSISRVQAPKKTILAGHVTHAGTEQLKFSYDLYSLLAGTKTTTKSIDEQGNFHIELDLKSPLKGSLYFGRDMRNGFGINKNIFVYLEPGDSIYITADLNVLADTAIIQKTLSITGTHPENSRFLNEQDVAFNSYPQLRQNNYLFVHDLAPSAYKKNVDSILAEQINFLNTYNDAALLSPRLKEIYINEATNLAGARKISYPGGHKSFNKLSEFNVPADYYDFMNDIRLTADFDKVGVPYLRFTHYYLKNKYQIAKDSGYKEDYITFVKQQLGKRASYVYMAYSLGTDFDYEVYKQFGKGTPYKDIQAIVKNKYSYLEKMLPGKPAEAVAFTDVKNQQVLSQQYFKGKFIYIDFWATWCKPCIAEMPDLDKLKKEYADQNIEFVSVSFDEDKKEWEDYVANEKLTGAQFWMDPKNKKLYKDQFSINMIPRFVLLDKHGNIVNGNAPRPSSGRQIRKELDDALRTDG